MTAQQTMQRDADANSLRKEVTVPAPPAVAWRVFTQEMTRWWPLASHKIGKAPAVDAVMEPRVGGRWYERGDDGSTCDWGRVVAWKPPSRLVLTWDISADWQSDPSLRTEVEVRFMAEGEDRTRVELEHRLLDRYGARRDEMRGIFDSQGGWGMLLAAFARCAVPTGWLGSQG
ncbi:MAG: SRPBCC family protein [Gemmataceae bacterium]|nr:SRPBCC family protein [Gemmataceae bacterium]